MKKVNPLQTGRFYRIKNPKRSFLCALCSAPRAMKYSKNLSFFNYIQITLVSVAVVAGMFPFFGVKAFFIIPAIWIGFEIGNKLLYRKEIPCPYCGFDATWYRRDVNFANSKVKEFWKKNYPDLGNPELENIQLKSASGEASSGETANLG